MGICLSPAAPQGAFENVERFAVTGNKNRDLRLPAAGCPLACKIRRLGSSIREGPPGQPEGEEAGDQQPALGQQHQQAQNGGEPGVEVETVGAAPVQITQRQQADQQNQAASGPQGR